MTPYARKLVEAAAKAARDSEAERAARATLLAAIDRLIETGPSEGMVKGLYDEPYLEYRDDYIGKESVVSAFRTMLRALREEIAEG